MERYGYYDKPARRRIVNWAVGAIAAAGTVLGLVECGPEILDKISHIVLDDSAVVAGVPGQVEGYDFDKRFNGKFWTYHYWLAIEQCPADVEAAKQGKPNQQSFDPAIDVVAPGCIVDWVSVRRGTYNDFQEGQVIVFKGDLGEQLLK